MYVEITEGNSTVASVEIRALPGVPDSGLTTYAYAMRSAAVSAMVAATRRSSVPPATVMFVLLMLFAWAYIRLSKVNQD